MYVCSVAMLELFELSRLGGLQGIVEDFLRSKKHEEKSGTSTVTSSYSVLLAVRNQDLDQKTCMISICGSRIKGC